MQSASTHTTRLMAVHDQFSGCYTETIEIINKICTLPQLLYTQPCVYTICSHTDEK